MLSRFTLALVALTAFSARLVASEPSSGATGFTVEFTQCKESIGVGLVPTAVVRALVPAEFILAGDGAPVTPLVVRTSEHRMSVAGIPRGVKRIVQIGAVIVPPDFTGDINNYTLYYYTDDLVLALGLYLSGVDVNYVPNIQFRDRPTGELVVQVPAFFAPGLKISGTITPSSAPAGSFLANWWSSNSEATVKMATSVPLIQIGGANLTLTTQAGTSLSALLGGTTFTFPIIQQYNTFSSATLEVQSTGP